MTGIGDGSPADGSETAGRPPRALGIVLGGAVLEAVGLTGGVVWAAADLLRGRSEAPGASVALALFLAGVAAAMVVAAGALRRGARRARGPVVTWQLLQAATGLALVGAAEPPSALPWASAAAILLAVVVTAAALSPSSLRFTAEAATP